MDNNLKEFLDNTNVNDFTFPTNYTNLKIHKEKYDDRFIILYSKSESKGLQQQEYSVAGYYDVIDKVLYNSTYEIREIIPNDNSIILDNFEKVFEKLCKEIDDYIKDYVILNADKYRKIGKDKYNESSEWQLPGDKLSVERGFAKNKEPVVKLYINSSLNKLHYNEEYYNKSIIVNYLNNPKKIVEEYAKEFITKDEEDLGVCLLRYEYKLKYLEQIKKNDNNEFKRVYINKKLLESLDNIDAKTINVTINYNEQEITFKYDLNKLLSSLRSASYKGYDYGSSYKKVREFFKENDIKDERGYHEDSFKFENITTITYGKKILYTNDISKQEKEIENDDFDLER